MKQIFAFVLIACLGIGSAQACVKKQAQAEQTKPLTVIVTDTTQALLANVELRAGKQVFRTSYDGRVVLQPEQLKGIRKIDISCAGYASQKLELSDSHAPVIVLAMVPAAVKTPKPTPVHHGYVLGGAVRRDEPVRELVMVKTVEETVLPSRQWRPRTIRSWRNTKRTICPNARPAPRRRTSKQVC